MSSLTPAARKAEATNAAMSEGMFSGLLTLIPSTAAVYYAMQRSPRFLARTNMQSRTGLAIMPAMFVFGWTAEERMTFKMREIAKEEAHSQASVRWAEEETQRALQAATPEAVPVVDREDHLMKLYQKSVQESGVRIVPGDELGVHHRMANFVSANPIKTLLAVAAPAISLIFYGQSGKEHVKLSMKLLHTRVFGQFATLSRTCWKRTAHRPYLVTVTLSHRFLSSFSSFQC
jgi:hypothetical protein